jgi:hypothetical protein
MASLNVSRTEANKRMNTSYDSNIRPGRGYMMNILSRKETIHKTLSNSRKAIKCTYVTRSMPKLP